MPEIESGYRARVSGWWSEGYTSQAVTASGSRKFGSRYPRVTCVTEPEKSAQPRGRDCSRAVRFSASGNRETCQPG